ncbi:MAG: Flp pilus assembly complex ATPase component TadA [Deltaproteobacteria bacterium]|nr:Flp pilus assembly complex ATPase component TadA [Deltaproteobacteria bacterium]
MAVKKLGELLVDAGLITQEQLVDALEEGKKQKGKRLGNLLVEKGFATELDIAETLAYQLNIPYIDLATAVIEPAAIKLVSEKLARQHIIIPLYTEKKNILRIAMSDPLNMEALDDIRFSTNYQCLPMVATSTDILMAIKTQYHLSIPIEDIVGDMVKEKFIEIVHDKELSKDTEELLKKSETPPIIKMVDSIIIHGIESRASDIHIEPQDRMIKLRERVDGLMRDVMQLPKWVQGAVTSRIKIMAKMDISERRIPQDGRIAVRIAGRELDMRISTLPTQYGEKIVMRILDTKSTVLTLNEIGLSTSVYDRVKAIIERPNGIVLVTGPTGSGKTSSLYAMIRHIKTPEVNVITLEDPIEYKLEGVNQVAINEKTGLTFAYCLRSVLRQDPDVIFVGEMRDLETAEIAHQASITGHLVFSTLHTTDAISTITRLKNMKIQPYLIASSLNGIVAQRLVRKLCESCKEPYNPTDEELLKVGIKAKKGDRPNLHRAKGCDKCGGIGYYGRTGAFEVLVINSQIKDMIVSNEPEEAIRKVALASGMVPMYKDGIAKVRHGLTTLDELQRVVFAKETEIINIICPSCSEVIRTEFSTCPHCGYSVIPKCPFCGREREVDWKHCPYCSTEFNKDIPFDKGFPTHLEVSR